MSCCMCAAKRKTKGLVFLIFRNETKRALLPNEVTSLDTIKALFVRAFCDHLCMSWFEKDGRKIYIMDQTTNVYYELEDLRDIKDRSVLKIYSPDMPVSNSPSLSPAPRDNHHGYESDSSVRSAPAMLPRSPKHVSHPTAQRPYSQEVSSKSSSLPVQPNYAYPRGGGTSHPAQPPGSWGSPTHSHRPQSQISPLARHGQASPVRSPVQNRHSVAYMPQLPIGHLGTGEGFHNNQLPQSRSYQDYPDQRSSGSVTPSMEDSETRERMQRMEAQLASLTAMVQTAVVLKGDNGSRPGSARSNSSLMSEGSSSVRSSKDAVMYDFPPNEPPQVSDSQFLCVRPVPSRYRFIPTAGSISHSDSTTPIVQSPSISSYQGISDGSTATPQPAFSIDIQNNMRTLYQRAKELRLELNKIRRMQITNKETMQETVHDAFKKIKAIIERVPGAHDQVLRSQRDSVSGLIHTYQEEADKVEKDLSDLSTSVEDLRQDVLNKGCRINKEEIQTMALALSKVSKQLGELKGRFPQLQENMKSVMAGEMQVVVREERFLKYQPEVLDDKLKKCEKLVKVLLTLKRLGSVQEVRPVIVPSFHHRGSPDEVDRRRVMEDIVAMVPDHDNRQASVEATEAARERKKKITSNAEALRFEKTLENAQNKLRNNQPQPPTNSQPSYQPQNTDNRVNIQDLESQKMSDCNSGSSKVESPSNPNLPLTDTTKKITMMQHGMESNGNPNVVVVLQTDDNVESVDRKTSQLNTDSIVVDAAPKLNYDSELLSLKTQSSASSVTQSPSMNPNISGSSVQGQLSRLSTFGISAVTSTPNGDPMEADETCQSEFNSPSTINKSSNMNSTRGHVSFSSTVTEIPSPCSPGKDGTKPKKIPPPPPPRKSSRLLSPTPMSGLMVRPVSPPTYENIEKFSKKATSPPGNSNNGVNTGSCRNGGSVSKNGSPPSRIPQIGGGQNQQQQYKPVTKYQQELASGIYSNMNRPDLQEQKLRAVQVVRSAGSENQTTVVVEEGDSSDSSASGSLQGTVKRRPLSKESSPQPPASDLDMSQSNDGSRKIPPPPPVRKTSALSQSPSETTPNSPSCPSKLSPDGNSKIPKIGGSYGQKKLTNGDIKSKSVTSKDKSYNETEIY